MTGAELDQPVDSHLKRVDGRGFVERRADLRECRGHRRYAFAVCRFGGTAHTLNITLATRRVRHRSALFRDNGSLIVSIEKGDNCQEQVAVSETRHDGCRTVTTRVLARDARVARFPAVF